MKKIIPLFLALILVFSLNATVAFAGATSYTIDDTYKTVYPARQGSAINRDITLTCQNITNAAHHNDVRMLGKNGNVIWEEYGAVGHNGTETFECGPDVYAIQVRVGPKNVFGLIWPRKAGCTVSW